MLECAPPLPLEGTPMLVHCRKFCGDDPRFWDFQSDWVLIILCLITIWLTLIMIWFLEKKISLSLSKILGPKVGLLCHQNVLFNSFYEFWITFLLDFQSNWAPFKGFFIDLRSVWPLIFTKLSDSVKMLMWAGPSYREFGEVPLHPSPRDCPPLLSDKWWILFWCLPFRRMVGLLQN